MTSPSSSCCRRRLVGDPCPRLLDGALVWGPSRHLRLIPAIGGDDLNAGDDESRSSLRLVPSDPSESSGSSRLSDVVPESIAST